MLFRSCCTRRTFVSVAVRFCARNDCMGVKERGGYGERKRERERKRECNIYYNDAHVANKLLAAVVHKCRVCLRNIYSVRFTLLFRMGGAPQYSIFSSVEQ